MICRHCRRNVPNAPFCNECGKSAAPEMNLEELHQQWEMVHYRRLGRKGIEGYKTSWQLLEHLKERPVSSIELEDYQMVMDSIADKSYSRQQKLKQLISQLCKFASIRHIPIPNYAEFLILEGYRSKSRLIFSDEEIRRLYFYAASSGNRYWEAAQIVLLLIFTGLRPEEMFDVRKEQVDLAVGKIYSVGSKTQAGRDRCIPIAAPIEPFLFYWMMVHKNSPYLLTSPMGCRIHLTNWRDRKFYPLLRELGINSPDDPHRLVPYCCRHTYASLAKRAGVDAGILSKMIGHADPKLTEEVYTHEGLSEMKREVEKITQLTKDITGITTFFCVAKNGVA